MHRKFVKVTNGWPGFCESIECVTGVVPVSHPIFSFTLISFDLCADYYLNICLGGAYKGLPP